MAQQWREMAVAATAAAAVAFVVVVVTRRVLYGSNYFLSIKKTFYPVCHRKRSALFRLNVADDRNGNGTRFIGYLKYKLFQIRKDCDRADLNSGHSELVRVRKCSISFCLLSPKEPKRSISKPEKYA
jgi:hypothetical protein